MKLRELLELRRKLKATSSRGEKVALIAQFIRKTYGEDLRLALDFLAGRLPGIALNVGPASLRKTLNVPFSGGKPLELSEVYRYLREIASVSGRGAASRRLDKLGELMSRASPEERRFLAELIVGEVRQGAGEGLIRDAIALASGRRKEEVDEAFMFGGDIGEVARVFMETPDKWRELFRPGLFVPIKPMLAESAPDLDSALSAMENPALEFKMDGVRVQIHRDGEDVRVYSRHLRDLTEKMPEVVELVRGIPVKDPFIIEGEVVAFSADGRPLPFQYTMRRIGRKGRSPAALRDLPLRLFLFDVLYLGEPLLDQPYRRRLEVLGHLEEAGLEGMPRLIGASKEEAEEFLKKAMELGHEGLMAKNLESPYVAGTRGSHWLKIKPIETLDLVVLAADWGHGRRRGWLSNYHLGILDRERKRFLMVGKTFKGLTDDEFRWMTEKLLSLKVAEDGATVFVRPEVVVEVAFNEVQKSPHYDSGFALRFARIKRIRKDKKPQEADTIDRLLEIYELQLRRKGGLSTDL